jgi:hypothetical protein
MSATETPAAHLARLKVQRPGWQIGRTPDGFVAVDRATGKRITAATVSELDGALIAQGEWAPR